MNALMYHDLVATGDEDSSGFPGRDAALYKITPQAFAAHLAAISQSLAPRADSSHSVSPARPAPPALPAHPAPVITFDDGGRSAMMAAEMLEGREWRGHFFITTNYVGTYGFLTRNEIRELASRGHAIGAHSCSHPLRMARCPWQRLIEEWSRSCATLGDIIGGPVTEASVPGGDFAPQVADAAARAGIVRLFTSEPTAHIRHLFGATVTGRFAIQRWSRPATAAAIAAGEWLPCARQAIAWNAKKVTKRLGGASYLRIRRLLLRQGNDVRWGDIDG